MAEEIIKDGVEYQAAVAVAVTVDDTPDAPLFVQDQQQICNEECTITAPVGVWVPAASFTRLLDRSMATSISTVAGGTILMAFNSTALIGRIVLSGTIIAAGSVTVTHPDGTTTVYVPPASVTGWDSGNLIPQTAVSVTIVQGAGAVLSEVSIWKVFEVKGDISIDWENTPGDPLFTQEQGQVGNEEATITATVGVWVGALTNILDKDRTTGTTSVAGGTLLVSLNAPLLISSLSILGNLPGGDTVTVTWIDNTTTVFTTVVNPCGWDSGNFPAKKASTITIVGGAGIAILELGIYKAKEVKSYSEVMQAGMGEFYGQKVYFDPMVINSVPCYYLLMRDPLGVSADNDPAQDLDGTTALIPISGDAVRIALFFYVPHDDIRRVRRHAKVTICGEIGASATWTKVRCRAYRTVIATGVQTALSAEKSVTLNLLGAASRCVEFLLQDLDYAAIAQGEVLTLQVSLYGSATVASYIRLNHSRGKPQVRFVSEIITGVPEITGA